MILNFFTYSINVLIIVYLINVIISLYHLFNMFMKDNLMKKYYLIQFLNEILFSIYLIDIHIEN